MVCVEKGDTIQLKKLTKDGVWEVVINNSRTAHLLIVENPGNVNTDDYRHTSGSSATSPAPPMSPLSLGSKEREGSSLDLTLGLKPSNSVQVGGLVRSRLSLPTRPIPLALLFYLLNISAEANYVWGCDGR